MQSLEVSGAVRPIYGSLGVKRLNYIASHSNCIKWCELEGSQGSYWFFETYSTLWFFFM